MDPNVIIVDSTLRNRLHNSLHITNESTEAIAQLTPDQDISMLRLVPGLSLRKQLPADWTIDYAEPRLSELIPNVRAATVAALQAPLSSIKLSEYCDPQTRVVIVMGSMPSALAHKLLGPVLDEVKRGGTAAARITILIATEEQCVEIAAQVAGQAQVVVNDVSEPSEHDDLGNLQGVPLRLNYRVAEADVLVVIHAVVSDAFAIYTNTGTALISTAAGAATQNELRDARFLAENVGLHGHIRDLSYQRVLADTAHRAGLKFAVGVVLDEHDGVMVIQAGEPMAVNDLLLPTAQSLREAVVPHDDYDILFVESDDRPLNLFETSAIVARLGNMPSSPLMYGGVMVMEVAADDLDRVTGLSGPVAASAQHFYDAMGMTSTPDEVLKFLDRHVLKIGEEQAYLFAKALEHYKVIFVGEQADDLARLCHCLSARDWRDGAELAESLVGHRPRTLIVSRPRFTIPLLGGPTLSDLDEDLADSDPVDAVVAGVDDNDSSTSNMDALLQDMLRGVDGRTDPDQDGADWIDDVERLFNTKDP